MGLEEAVVNQATVWPESGADRTASSRENPAPSTAPNQYNPNQIFQIGNGFGFFLIFLSRYNTLWYISAATISLPFLAFFPILIFSNTYYSCRT